MYPAGTRIGYSICPRGYDMGSFGLRFTATILDNVFVAKYSGQLTKVAFWIRAIAGTPQRSHLTLTLYEDGGSIPNPGTVLESISGGTGSFGVGRLEFSGFTTNLVAGRRYRLRLTTSNNVDANYGEFLLGHPVECGDMNESGQFCYDSMQWRWSGADNYSTRANMQVFQSVSGNEVSDDVLLTDATTTYLSHQGIGVRFVAPPGPTLRYLGLVVNRITMSTAAARCGYWYVKKGNDIIGVTGVFPGFTNTTIPDSNPYWGLWLYRFTRPLELEGGQTYDFIFSVAGSHDSSNNASFLTFGIDPTYVPAWMQRYKLLQGSGLNEVTNRVLPTFFLVMDDVQPLPDASGIFNPYIIMPVA